jgi:2,4-diketo-3-deoxy-L-fuconate hydrolase
MRLCRYHDDRLGVVLGDGVHDVTDWQTRVRQSRPYIFSGDPVIAALGDSRDELLVLARSRPPQKIETLKLLAPVARPTKIVAAPANFNSHGPEMAELLKNMPGGLMAPIDQAGLFLKANSSLVGPSEGIPIRFADRRNDHEVEIVVVIGRECSRVSQESALDFIAGYSLGVDVTVRGTEDRSFRKSCDGYAVMGPWLVCAEEVQTPDALEFSLSCNGEPRQSATTRDMNFSVAKLIEFASRFYTLYPGDLIYSGTPGGVGPISAGDVLRVSSPQIGEFEVSVVAG